MSQRNPEFQRQLWLNWRPSQLGWSLLLTALLLLPLAVAGVIACLLSPLVEGLVKWKIRRSVAVIGLFVLATMAFQAKRKTLANGIAQGLGRPRADVDHAIEALGIDPGLRPQALSVEDWALLAEGFPP